MNGELLKNNRSIFVEKNMITTTYNYNLLNNVLSILGRYNYTLSIEAIDTFCRLDWNYRVKLLSDIGKTLYEEGKKEGVEVSNFYVNYPNEVKSQDKRELYINSLLYFYHNFWNGIDEETLIDKPELTEDISLTELNFVTEYIKTEESVTERINEIEENLGLGDNVVVVSEDDHYNQMELFDQVKSDIQEEEENVEEEAVEEPNENQMTIFEEEEEYSDISLEELDDELENEDEEEIDELDEDLSDEEEDISDEDFEEEFINPYDDEEESEEESEEEDIKEEVYPEVEGYENSSVEEIQEEIDEYEEDYIALVKLDETPSEAEKGKKPRKTKEHIDTLIEERKYMKLVKNLKKEPNELARRIMFVLEGITYKYEKKEERIELSSKALGIFEGIVDEVSYDILTDLYKDIKYREASYLEKNLQKSFKELKKIIKEEARERKKELA